MDCSPLITLVVPEISVGGAEIVNTTLAKQFLDRGLRVHIATCRDHPDSRLLIPPSARHVVLGAQRARDFLLPFARYLRRERPDAVMVSMWPLTTICLLAHQLARSRSQIVVRDTSTMSDQYADSSLIHRLMLKESIALSYPLANARVAVSGGVADDLSAMSGIRAQLHDCRAQSFDIAVEPGEPSGGGASLEGLERAKDPYGWANEIGQEPSAADPRFQAAA